MIVVEVEVGSTYFQQFDIQELIDEFVDQYWPFYHCTIVVE